MLDAEGARILIPDPVGLQCDPGGMLFYTNDAGDFVPVAQFGLADFVNPGGLAAFGDSYFIQTVNSGELLGDVPVVIHQGYTEVSNVDLANEMTRLIRAQRAYQLAARCVTTADQMMQVANAIRS